jgi:hypothetical protein
MDDVQHLALDDAQHFLPYFSINRSQTYLVILSIVLMGDMIC